MYEIKGKQFSVNDKSEPGFHSVLALWLALDDQEAHIHKIKRLPEK